MIPAISSTIATSYQHLLKPILFKFDAETVHNSFTSVGKTLGTFPLARDVTSSTFAYNHPQLSQTFDGIRFPNPVGLSAGFDYNGELTDILPGVGFGWHTIGTITLEPYEGNAKPRLGRFPKSQALLVNKGLKNWGAVKIIEYLEKKQFTIPTGISIATTNRLFKDLKDQLSDIAQCFKLFEASKVNHAYYELNISCPNTFGGEPFTDPDRLEILLKTTDKLHLTKPMYIKMPIDQSESLTLAMLQVIQAHNAQGLIFGNLTKDHHNPAVHPDEQKIWQTQKGNLSGKPTWDRSNTLLKLAKKKYGQRFTLVGTGGVFSGADAQKKLDYGADLIQLISGMIFKGPQVIGQINHHLLNHHFHQAAK